MQIRDIPFTTTDWSTVPATEHPGTTGMATWRTLEAGGIRVRVVEYGAGYVADHWCKKGHVVHVLSGELVTELEDGRTVTLTAGMSYRVGDDVLAHRSRTLGGAKLFIVD